MIRVFPRKTTATPDDDQVFFGGPPLWDLGESNVHVSCTFTFDKGRAEHLAEAWSRRGYDVSLDGPAYDCNPGEFEPGKYIRHGLVITSRGCNNDCWFCKVPEREGGIRELDIKDGYDLLDNNLLQCSESHIRRVFEMLNRQDRRSDKGRRLGVKLTGGLEAEILKDWHVDLIDSLKLKPEIIYFAYDTPDDLEPLIEAAKKMRSIGFTNQRVGCYVLMGWPKDRICFAQDRLQRVIDLDMMPYGMLYADKNRNPDPEWTRFQRNYTKPMITRKLHKGEFGRYFKKL